MAVKVGISKDDERGVYALRTKRRELEDGAAKKTKTARRAVQERKQHEKARVQKAEDLPTVANPAPSVTKPAVLRGYDPSNVKALDDDE